MVAAEVGIADAGVALNVFNRYGSLFFQDEAGHSAPALARDKLPRLFMQISASHGF